jgi:hypothetical protein
MAADEVVSAAMDSKPVVTVADTATGESGSDGAGPVVGITVTARLIRDSSRSTAMRRDARQTDRDRRFPPREAMWVPLRETAARHQPLPLRWSKIYERSPLPRYLALRPCQEKRIARPTARP